MESMVAHDNKMNMKKVEENKIVKNKSCYFCSMRYCNIILIN